ncbi:unnamed protein product [Moneuplotes crassus]|uniref:Uncharacterized protein n=1 Tax=Euplotes crassus TaxID=5936 RepID=A0AAD2CZQ1_EUPCR|nr:unnamed protein product [Moneuplotes crassus]
MEGSKISSLNILQRVLFGLAQTSLLFREGSKDFRPSYHLECEKFGTFNGILEYLAQLHLFPIRV